MKAVLDPIHPVCDPPVDDSRAIPTAHLLRAFITDRDESAFAALVQRHGAMVLGVCRRVTGNPHDADDAFQATFLVLARKAHTVRPPEQLDPWLYGVAYRTARKARSTAARRREGERRFAQMTPDTPDPCVDDPQWNDLRPLLDEEIDRLPAGYRAAIVACDLEGKSRQAAAVDLAINEGTLSSRLSRGREILAARLTRRGVALSAAAVASLMSVHAATAAPAAALVATTTMAAVSFATGGTVAAGIASTKVAILSEGVLHAMFIAKAKIIASLVLAAALTGTGVAVVTQIAMADKAAKAPQSDNPGDKGGKLDKPDYLKPDLAGTVTDVAPDGKQITLRASKASKAEPAGAATFQITAATDITFSAIAPLGDAVIQGYEAQVWLEPNSKDRAARVAYSGHQSLKDSGPIDAGGKIASVSPDGKRITVESRAPAEKGVKNQKGADPVLVDVNLTAGTRITFSAVTTGGASLQEGYDAQITFDPNDPGSAAVARITGAEAGAMKGALAALGEVDLTGKVVAVAADGKSVTLETRPEPKKLDKGDPAPEGKRGKVEIPVQRVDVSIAAATKVIYTGVAAGGATPTEGYRATVWLDGAAARTIHFDAAAGREKKGPDFSSQVLAISPDGKRITVTAQAKTKGENPEQCEIDMTGAKIIYNNVHPGEAKPGEGYQAQVWVDPQAPGIATIVTFEPAKSKK